MNREESDLHQIEEKINADLFSLRENISDEACCLDKTEAGWECYYTVKGRKSGIRTFKNVDDACDYFYSLIKADTAS